MDGIDLGAEVRRIVSKMTTINPDLATTARYQQIWREVADPSAVSHTDAIFVVPNTDGRDVIVYVDSQLWATELGLQAELLRLRMNLRMNELYGTRGAGDEGLFDYEQTEYIRRLQFMPSKEKYAHNRAQGGDTSFLTDGTRDVEPAALDAEEMAELQRQVEGISNPELRAAAFEAARANLELLKGACKD